MNGTTRKTNYKLSAFAMMALALLADHAEAGENQIALRLGEDWVDIDGDRLSTGNSVNDHLANLGALVAYRWQRGGYVELGLSRSGTLDLFGIRRVDHHWLGAGWQFDVGEKVRLTPKAGLTYSKLKSSEATLVVNEPVDEFTDVVPFLELTAERRLREHFGLGLYFRHTFEDWGSTRDFGVTVIWTLP